MANWSFFTGFNLKWQESGDTVVLYLRLRKNVSFSVKKGKRNEEEWRSTFACPAG